MTARHVLADTGPLVAVCDPQDRHHARAMRELDAVRAPVRVALPVLTEALHFLCHPGLRLRLEAAFSAGLFEIAEPPTGSLVTARRALGWLARYGEHSPDFADAFLVTWSDAEHLPVWTFDSEFTTTWRSAKGRRVRLFEPPVR